MKYPSDWREELSRKPICGVLSTAMIAGVTFDHATDAIKKNLMPHQKRHGGKTYHEQRCNALKMLGVAFSERAVYDRITLQKWIANYARFGKTYMITTSSHVVTVKNGLVADQVEIADISEHNSRRCIVRHVLEIK